MVGPLRASAAPSKRSCDTVVSHNMSKLSLFQSNFLCDALQTASGIWMKMRGLSSPLFLLTFAMDWRHPFALELLSRNTLTSRLEQA